MSTPSTPSRPSGWSVAGLALRSPVLVAAGCGGTGRELAGYGALADLGAFVTRTITTEARPGAPAGCVVESPAGLVHATGTPNPGVDHFLATELPWLATQDARVVVSLAATSVVDAGRLARRLAHAPGLAAVEVALAPPDGASADLATSLEPHEAAATITAVLRELPPGVSVWAKLRSDPGRVVETARAVGVAGAGAVVVGDAQPAALPDGRDAGLSGPAVRPIALRCVRLLRSALPHLDVVGCGGVATPADVRAYLAAGAVAVAVGTAVLHDPTTAHRLAAALREDPA